MWMYLLLEKGKEFWDSCGGVLFAGCCSDPSSGYCGGLDVVERMRRRRKLWNIDVRYLYVNSL